MSPFAVLPVVLPDDLVSDQSIFLPAFFSESISSGFSRVRDPLIFADYFSITDCLKLLFIREIPVRVEPESRRDRVRDLMFFVVTVLTQRLEIIPR